MKFKSIICLIIYEFTDYLVTLYMLKNNVELQKRDDYLKQSYEKTSEVPNVFEHFRLPPNLGVAKVTVYFVMAEDFSSFLAK